MNRVFLYYSHSGNGDAVAETMKGFGYDIRKVEAQRELPKSLVFSILSGGFLAGIGWKTKLKEFNPDLSGYTEIVIGSPVWNGRLASPINTVLSEVDLNDKKTSFILYSGSGSAAKTVSKLIERYSCEVVELKEPKTHPEEMEKLEVFR